MRKVIAIAILMLFPGCLDTAPETLEGVEILAPDEIVEGDSAEIRAHGTKPSGAKYLWDFGDNLGGSGANVNHVFVEEGQYTITLTVIDGEGSIGVSKKVISVLHKNEPPVASLDSTYGGLGQSIKVNSIAFFDGGASSDPDGDVLSFSWDFGDGNVGEGIRPNHFYESVGNFTVTLVVTDQGNLSSISQTWVLVQERTYSITFRENTVIRPALAGYTAEGATTIQTHAYPYNLTTVNYDLEWEEDEALDSPNNFPLGTLFPDDFSLGVSTNYLFNLSENGTSGNLEVNFDVLSATPSELVLSLDSEDEVEQYLFQNGYTSAKGQGEWTTSITCNDAPSIVPEVLSEVDQGNDWILYVTYIYYESIIVEL